MSEIPPSPYIATAVICVEATELPDKSMNVTGIVDAIEMNPPLPEEDVNTGLKILIRLTCGEPAIQGRWSLAMVTPAGAVVTGFNSELRFPKPHTTATTTIPLTLHAPEEGRYFFDLAFDGRLLTRIPLKVIYTRGPLMNGHQAKTP